MDPTLLEAVDVAAGLSREGAIIINTPSSPSEIRKKLKLQGAKVFAVDATAISTEKLGRNIPNTPMVGALLKVSEIMKLDTLLDYFKKEYASKFRPEVIEGNLGAIQKAYDSVKGE